jgi:hypothetical protein
MTETTTTTKRPTKAQQKATDRADAIATLKKHLKPGAEVLTILRHVAKSGMMRVIDVYVAHKGDMIRLTWAACEATGIKYNRKHEGAEMGGCGMDMGFALVYELSRVMFPKGFPCTGKDYTTRGACCPSCDHSNRDPRGFAKGIKHADGGYALRHRWL